jgi:hypothetical protein
VYSRRTADVFSCNAFGLPLTEVSVFRDQTKNKKKDVPP